jgi:hypothetical protein
LPSKKSNAMEQGLAELWHKNGVAGVAGVAQAQ